MQDIEVYLFDTKTLFETKKLLEKYLSSTEGVAYFLDRNLFQEIKDREILLRVLEKIIMNISGSIYPPRRNKLEKW